MGTAGCGRLEELADPSVATPAGEGVPALAVNEDAVALLPSSVASPGVLRVAIPTNEPPTQFYKEGSRYMTGVNPDIARFIGWASGLTSRSRLSPSTPSFPEWQPPGTT